MRKLELMAYFSLATGPTESLGIIADILAVSQRNNGKDGLTGALAICDGWFFQAIEGSPSAIDGLLRRLEADPRHTDIRVLLRQPAATRLFRERTMTSVRITPDFGPDRLRLISECQTRPEMAVVALKSIVDALHPPTD
ncbi:BLUF domain-containing protein [Brevundimonas sp. DC300-4]|uniref:BLUF domain-containing protein n=1 Tax=Brevundimonas sp. DC300-4 TaxID=2804594 RepID=UPI003CF49C6B